jgi:hypothetical protein
MTRTLAPIAVLAAAALRGPSPLYLRRRLEPGEVNGNDFSSFGAQWYALRPSGEEAGG